jgi:hypothetical protein
VANENSITYERILLLKFPEESFSTATGVYTQNPRPEVSECKCEWLLKNSLFIPIGQNLGDGKCLGDPRKSILELPDAILFSSILREGVFQQPHDLSPTM